MRRFVIGDIHGGYKSLMQCLQKANFNYEEDLLINLGDICDGWPDSKKCIDELLKIKNLINIIGNHDKWVLEWMTEPREIMWDTQGGKATFHSYVPEKHIEFLKRSYLWEVIDNKLFVHGGIDPNQKDITKQHKETCLWDRQLLETAIKNHPRKPNYKWGGFDEIYIGHTSINWMKLYEPTKFCNVWAMDTGGGWGGVLSMMDIDTKETFISDFVKGLYPNDSHR